MFKTKTGIQIPEKTDKIYSIGEALNVLLDIVTKLALEVDKLRDEMNELKINTDNKQDYQGVTITHF